MESEAQVERIRRALAMHPVTMPRSSRLKRALDLVVVAGAVVVLGLPFLVVVLLVRWRLGAPVLFRQERPGRFGRTFTMTKLRTMTDARDAGGRLLPDSERLTAVGRFLRRTSLDELPTLWNVLTGDMSIVGPRPLLVRYLPYFSDEECLRFLVRPGITGLAQVRGRNLLGWDERLGADVEYVRNCSLGLDARIIGQTLRQVLGREGVVVDPTSLGQDLDRERSGPR